MSKIDFSKPIQIDWAEFPSDDNAWANCKYIGPHPELEFAHVVLASGMVVIADVSQLRNKPESITAKKLYDNLYQEAVQDGLGWATPSQIKDMLFEKLAAFGMIDEGATYETK